MTEGKRDPGTENSDRSLLDQCWTWFEQNRHILWGGGALFVGFYLLAKTYSLFVQVAVAAVGAMLVVYGLSELRVTSIQRLYRTILQRAGF